MCVDRSTAYTSCAVFANRCAHRVLPIKPFAPRMRMFLCSSEAVIFSQSTAFVLHGGRRGIRTPETFRFNGFQDRRDRPLRHPSTALSREKTVQASSQREMVFEGTKRGRRHDFRGHSISKAHKISRSLRKKPKRTQTHANSQPLCSSELVKPPCVEVG